MKRLKREDLLVWEGSSELTGEPIFVAANGIARASSNGKTGPMIQLWILRSDIDPVKALMSDQDKAICGLCPLKRLICYVNVGRAPWAVYWRYKRGKTLTRMRKKHLPLFGIRPVRFGAYGDPAAVPYEVWEPILQHATRGWTGYTHQWRDCDPKYREFLMASAETGYDQVRAFLEGWRTFRLLKKGEGLRPGEARCPASDEAGKRLKCHECRACDGLAHGTRHKASIALDAHGGPKVHKFNKLVEV